MSKRSQEEARRTKERNEQERHSKFLTTLKGYLSTFGQVFRQEVSDDAVGAYAVALQHLSPYELKLACDESVKVCKFFPNPAEILQALGEWRRANQTGYGTYTPPTNAGMNSVERNALASKIREAAKKLGIVQSFSSRKVDMRSLSQWTEEERTAFMNRTPQVGGKEHWTFERGWQPEFIEKPLATPREPGCDDD